MVVLADRVRRDGLDLRRHRRRRPSRSPRSPAPRASAGIILAIFALGSLISGLLYGTRHWKRPAVPAVRHRDGRAGGRRLASSSSCSRCVALAAVMFVAGFAIAPTLINGNGLVQDLVPRERLTEGLTWVGTSLGVGVSVGSSIAGRADRRRRVARRVPRGRRLRRARGGRDARGAAHPARRRRRARARLRGGRVAVVDRRRRGGARARSRESVEPTRSVGTLDA